jgi:hypothetical protein
VLCELWSVLASVLERNVSVDAVREFKLENRRHLARLAALVRQRLPQLDEDSATDLVNCSVVVLAGLWPFANPTPTVREATDDPRLVSSQIDFAESLSRTLHLVTTGLLHDRPAHPTAK